MQKFHLAVLFFRFLALRMFYTRRSETKKPPCQIKFFQCPWEARIKQSAQHV
jgi:hypothetical protein